DRTVTGVQTCALPIYAPYVVSNFARSGTRVVASAYFVRSHSARSRLFFGTIGWYARVRAPRGLVEGLEHPQIGELIKDLLLRQVEAQGSADHARRELDLDQAQRVAVAKDDLDVARVRCVVVDAESTGLVAGAGGAQVTSADRPCEIGVARECFVGGSAIHQDRGLASNDCRVLATLASAGKRPAVSR